MATFTGKPYSTADLPRYYTVAVDSNGNSVGWGLENNSSSAIPVPLISNVVAISANKGMGIATKSDGTIEIFGDPGKVNYVGPVPSGTGFIVNAAAGENHAVALIDDGTVVAWGDNYYGATSVPSGLSGVVDVAAGERSTAVLKSDGTVLWWGSTVVQSNVVAKPSSLSGVEQISLSFSHVATLKSDGTVVCFGSNFAGQCNTPSGLSGVIAVAAGFAHTAALKNDGSIVYWGSTSFGSPSGVSPTPAGLSDVAMIYAGYYSMMAIRTDGTIAMWGNEGDGELTPPSSLEVLIPGDPPPTVGNIFATLELNFSGQGPDLTVTGDMSANFDMAFSGTGFEDWASKLPKGESQESYLLRITDPLGGEDLILPISSWQATSQAEGRSSFLQAVIPAAGPYLEAIDERKDGSLVISKFLTLPDGSIRGEEIVRTNFDSFRYDRGPGRVTVTVSGYVLTELSPPSSSRTLTGIRSISSTNGKYRTRCDIDLFLKPGMTVIAENVSYEADFIGYYVSSDDTFCEVGER